MSEINRALSRNGISTAVCCVLVAGLGLAGCQTLGPLAISQGREKYNQTIHNTARDQMFANIIRVAHSENPLFMDVTEVDASQTFQGTLGASGSNFGGVTGISGALAKTPTTEIVSTAVGGATASIQYQEAPTIRYQPLSGQPLIAQISTPITVDSIVNLYDSDWPLITVLDLATDRFAPDGHSDAATNIMAALDDYDAITLAAGASAQAKAKSNSGGGNYGGGQKGNQSSPVQNDTLLVYLSAKRFPSTEPLSSSGTQSKKDVKPADSNLFRAAMTKLRLPFDPQSCAATYLESSSGAQPDEAKNLVEAKKNVLLLWLNLLKIFKDTQPPNSFTLAKLQEVEKANNLRCDRPVTTKSSNIDVLERTKEDIELSLSSKYCAKSPSTRKADERPTADKVVDGLLAIVPKSVEISTAPVTAGDAVTTDDAGFSVTIQSGNKTITVASAVGGRTKPGSRPPGGGGSPPRTNVAPPMRTHSALGILKYIMQYRRVEFVSPESYSAIRNEPWNAYKSDQDQYQAVRKDQAPEYYTLLASDLPPDQVDKSADLSCLSYWIGGHADGNIGYVFSPDEDIDNHDVLMREMHFADLRRDILIIFANRAPLDAFVSFADRGKVYYIAGDDVISRKNFSLLAEFMTMQAIPAQGGGLTPSINVGTH